MNKLNMALVALAITGCDTNDNALTILNVVIPEFDMTKNACTSVANLTEGSDALVLDTGGWLSLNVPFSVQNNLGAIEQDFTLVEGGPTVSVVKNVQVTPLRFAARYECDTSAYSGAIVNGLILPRFDPKDSFCVDKRSDAQAIDENSDILPAYGPAIPAGGAGVANVRAVPHELGRAVDELWDIAVLADKCCRRTECVGDLSDQDCRALQNIFDAVDGTGALSAAGMTGTQNLTLRRFADYAIYDGKYITMLDVEPRFDKVSTPSFPIFFRGQLEGVTGYGEVVQSNDYSLQIDVCRNCGPGHMPRGESVCIRE